MCSQWCMQYSHNVTQMFTRHHNLSNITRCRGHCEFIVAAPTLCFGNDFMNRCYARLHPISPKVRKLEGS